MSFGGCWCWRDANWSCLAGYILYWDIKTAASVKHRFCCNSEVLRVEWVQYCRSNWRLCHNRRLVESQLTFISCVCLTCIKNSDMPVLWMWYLPYANSAANELFGWGQSNGCLHHHSKWCALVLCDMVPYNSKTWRNKYDMGLPWWYGYTIHHRVWEWDETNAKLM